MADLDWATRINNAVETYDEEDERRVWEKLSIYRVPHYIKIDDPSGMAYSPQIVSIGPYHFGEEHLILMEEYKRKALARLLRETNKTIGDYMRPLREILPEMMDSYEQLDKRWRQEQDEFLQLLVIDGCFVIQTIRNYFDEYGFIEYIKRDLLLLENQLPLPVLENLMTVLAAAIGVQPDLNSLLLNFYFPGKGATCMGRAKHMLDVVRQGMIQSQDMDQLTEGSTGTTQSCQHTKKEITRTVINSRSATMLYHGGIKFIRNSTHCLNDIVFKNDNLYLPTITIERYSESMFLNIIAFEQLDPNTRLLMSSYFLFLGSLINSADDVRFLREKEIIKSSATFNDTIHEMFTKLTRGFNFGKNDNLYQLLQELDRCYLKMCDKYFEGHWSIIKLVVGIIFVVTVVVVACYHVLSYYKASHYLGAR